MHVRLSTTCLASVLYSFVNGGVLRSIPPGRLKLDNFRM
jgi:hypothetical protein